MGLDDVAVASLRFLPAIHYHMALHVAFGEGGHREFRLGRRLKRILALLDAVDDGPWPSSGPVPKQAIESLIRFLNSLRETESEFTCLVNW